MKLLKIMSGMGAVVWVPVPLLLFGMLLMSPLGGSRRGHPWWSDGAPGSGLTWTGCGPRLGTEIGDGQFLVLPLSNK